MPDIVTPEDVKESRERVDSLRAQIAAAKGNLVVTEASGHNAVRKARLDAEAVRLEQELAQINAQAQNSESSLVNPEPVITEDTPPMSASQLAALQAEAADVAVAEEANAVAAEKNEGVIVQPATPAATPPVVENKEK